MKKLFIYFPPTITLLLAAFLCTSVIGQQRLLKSGPMLGQVEYRTAAIWAELNPQVKTARIRYWKAGTNQSNALTTPLNTTLGKDFNPVIFQMVGLEPGTKYAFELVLQSSTGTETSGGFVQTKELWQWRKPAPDVSFITGSCSYVNEPVYDRPGKPYGGDSSIFLTMASERSDFMLWLGDNWYTREVDYFSEWGLWYRASHDRAVSVLQPLLKAMPQYAIWDDHDFGPNDMGTEYVLKEASAKVFSSYWANPSYGEYGKGVYSKISYSDVDIFMMDDRTWRSSDDLEDSIGGLPNPEKVMYGQQQMAWLKSALAGSRAAFKIIATGSQVLNPVSPFDCFRKFPVEYDALITFLRNERISGVIFLTGDRHHSEIIRAENLVGYPLFDVTASPLTSGTHSFGEAEKINPDRVLGIDQKQNYARVTVTGKSGNRLLTVVFKGIKGDELGRWTVEESQLKPK